MPHAIRIDDDRHVLHDAWSAECPALRIFRTANDDALVFVGADAHATRDGLPIAGGATVIAWGSSALLRLDGRQVEIGWQPGGAHRRAHAGERCRLCFGDFEAGDPVRTCSCLAVFHVDCDRARRHCATCGEPPGRGNRE